MEKRNMFAAWAAFVVVAGVFGDVVTNESLVITSPTTWNGVTNVYTAPVDVGSILADFTLDQRSYVRFMGANRTGVGTNPTDTKPQFYIATNANDVTVTVKGKSLFATTYRNSKSPAAWVARGIDPDDNNAAPSRVRVRLGLPNGEAGSTGRAKLVVEKYTKDTGFGSNVFGTFWAEWLFIESSVATNAPGMIDFLEIKSDAFADIAHIENNSPYPARILFNGGILFRNNANAHETSLCPRTGHEIICQSVDGCVVYLRKQFAAANMTGRMGGTVRIIGTDVRLHNEGSAPQWSGNSWNFHPWTLGAADNIIWEITGDINLTGNMWLRTDSDDVLPYGPGVGGMVVGYNSSSSYAEGNANGYQHHCCLDLYGTRQHLNSVTSTGTGAYVGIITNTASATGTLVLGAQDMPGTLNARCTGNVVVEKEGSGILTVRESSAELFAVNGGSAFFTGTRSAFTNITVAAGASLYGSVDVRGSISFSGEEAAISMPGFEPVLGSGAVMDLGADRMLTVKTLSVGGAYLAPGVYAAADTPWLANGSVRVLLNPSTVATDVSWTGAISTSASAAGNWGAAPDFSTATFRPIFASSSAVTSSAVLDSGADWNFLGLGFGGVSAFTLSGSDTINLYDTVSVTDPGLGVMPRYEVSAPIVLYSGQTINMPTDGAEIVFSGGIDGNISCGIELNGSKLSSLSYDYATNGVLTLVNPRVSGPILHKTGGGTLVLKGQVGNPGDTEPLEIYYGSYRNGSNINDGWCQSGATRFEGVTCWKPVTLTGRGQMSGATGVNTFFHAAAGTTNVFKEIVGQRASTTLGGDGVSATVVFEKGYRDALSGGSGFSANSATYVFEGPLVQVRNDREVTGSNAKHVFKSTGNRAAMMYKMYGGLEAEFHVDDAFDDTIAFLNGGTSVMNLNGTHQRWRILYGSDGSGTIKGDGALEITQGVANEGMTANTNLSSAITGFVSLAMSGPGWQRMKSKAFASYGDVEVSNGTLAFTDGASWRNGTNVTIRGAGTLRLANSGTFSDDCQFHASGDGWTLHLADGVVQKTAFFDIDGIRQSPGTWGSPTGGASHKSLRFSGGGVLHVISHGSTVLIR